VIAFIILKTPVPRQGAMDNHKKGEER
jgi:hypothetical protein